MKGRFPEDLQVSLDDFRACGWRAILDSREVATESPYLELYKASEQAEKEGRLVHGKVLALLAAACSLRLNPRNRGPFGPTWISPDSRSAIPDDFSEEDILFFTQIVDEIDVLWMRARLADLLWIRSPQRERKRFAELAIDAYRRLPLNADTWHRGGKECWTRALHLASIFKAGDGGRFRELENTILNAFVGAGIEEKFFAIWMAELLREFELGQAARSQITQTLKEFGDSRRDRGDTHGARQYYVEAKKWFLAGKQAHDENEMRVRVAETWAADAKKCMSAGPEHASSARTWFRRALDEYQPVPNKYREEYQVDEHIEELRKGLETAGPQAVASLELVQLPAVDISEEQQMSRELVQGKPFQQALEAFTHFPAWNLTDRCRESVSAGLSWASLFPTTHFSLDGRVVGSTPGWNPTLPESEQESLVSEEMLREHEIFVSVVVQGMILPALEAIREEHALPAEDDFVAIALRSPIVPEGRERFFGKAFHFGFQGDFITAIHLLVPQVEHMVRIRMKKAGETTTTLQPGESETENGLNTLLRLPAAEALLGKDLAFDFKALFCDARGPNLRNNVAHGLLGPGDCFSPRAIYAWWLILSHVCNSAGHPRTV